MRIKPPKQRLASATTRYLLLGGVIGPLLFVLLFLIEGATRPGYSPLKQAVSELSLSSQGWIQIVNFIVSGLLILGFAIGLRRILQRRKGTAWGPLLLAAVGLGLVAAGIFVTDPALGYPPGTPPGPALHDTWHGILHWYAGGLIFFGCLSAASFVFARRLAMESQRLWALYSLLSGIGMMVFFAAFAAAGAFDGPAGLFQRLSIGTGMIWLSLFACKLLRAEIRK